MRQAARAAEPPRRLQERGQSGQGSGDQGERRKIVPDMQAELAALEARIGHRFVDSELLRRALRHSTYANESRARNAPLEDNEQLEFLGDAVLGLMVSEALVARH